MKDNVMVQLGLDALMVAAVETDDIGFKGDKILPFTNDVDPGKLATLTDFTAATFNGSAAKVITWGTKFHNAAGDAEVLSGLEQFTTDGVIPETVYGYCIVDGTDPTKLRWYSRLDDPKGFNVAGDTQALVVRLVLSATGFGASIVVSE